jgi:hypothetical protein
MSWLICESDNAYDIINEDDIRCVKITNRYSNFVVFLKASDKERYFDKIFVKKYDSISEALVALRRSMSFLGNLSLLPLARWSDMVALRNYITRAKKRPEINQAMLTE